MIIDKEKKLTPFSSHKTDDKVQATYTDHFTLVLKFKNMPRSDPKNKNKGENSIISNITFNENSVVPI